MAAIAADTTDADITHKMMSATDNTREQVVQALGGGGGDSNAANTSATKEALPRPSLMAFMLRG